MATIDDLARAAGVSHGTVSNVLNNRNGVSYQKIRQVQEAAQRIGYQIDRDARTLRKGSASLLVVLLPNVTSPVYADLYTGILRCAEKRNYAVQLYLTDDLASVEREKLHSAQGIKLSGVLTVSCLSDIEKGYASLTKNGLPVLSLLRHANRAIPSFTFDMRQAACLAGKQLPENAECACITADLSFSDQQRFANALFDTKKLCSDAVYQDAPARHSTAIERLIAEHPSPAALVTTDAQYAERLLMHYARPQTEIISLAPLRIRPSASFMSICLNYRAMGDAAAAAVIDSVEQGASISSRVFPVSKVSRPLPILNVKAEKTLHVLSHNTPAMAALKALAPIYTRRTGVRVEIETCSLSEFYQRFPRDPSWDIIRLDPSTLPYRAPQLLRALDTLDKDAHLALEHFLPGVVKNYSYSEDQLYALPFDISVQMLFFRRSLFESSAQRRAYYEINQSELEIPRTFDDFNKVSRFFTREYRDASPTEFGTYISLGNPTSTAMEFFPRLMENDGMIYNRQNILDFSTPAALSALNNLMESTIYSSKVPVYSWSDIALDLLNDRHALSILYINHASHIALTNKSETSSKIGFAPVPGNHPLLGGGALGVSLNSPLPEEAYDFIRWATSEELAPDLVMLGGTSACRIVYEMGEILEAFPWLSELPNSLNMGTRKPIFSSVPTVYNQHLMEFRLGEYLIDVIKGRLQPTEALRLIQLELQNIKQ
ncbi:MAG: extracellular solute-binding protein [Eubacteriales bacterium]|nr:extracellular solute-binding protein [Eubacteriales bacterium]